MVYTLRFFFIQNAVCFIILMYLVPVLFTFYIQCVLKFKKIISAGAKRLILFRPAKPSDNKMQCFFYMHVNKLYSINCRWILLYSCTRLCDWCSSSGVQWEEKKKEKKINQSLLFIMSQHMCKVSRECKSFHNFFIYSYVLVLVICKWLCVIFWT